MKKYFTLVLFIGLLLASCNEEDVHNLEQQVPLDLYELAIVDEASVNEKASKLDFVTQSKNDFSIESRSTWQYHSTKTYTSSVGWHGIAFVNKSTLNDYDVKVVISSSNNTGAIATHGYSPFRMIGWDYVYPNTSHSKILTLEDLNSTETRGYFHSYSWTNGTVYNADIYIKARPTVPVSPNADDYPWPGTTACHTTGGCDADIWLSCKSNCTSWVFWKVNQACGITSLNLPLSSYKLQNHTSGTGQNRLSHAHRWDERLEAIGWIVNNTPEAGAICNWETTSMNNAYGHVAYIHDVNPDGSIVISEYNYSPACEYNTRTLYPSNSDFPDHIIHVPI